MSVPIEKTYTIHLPLERDENTPPIMTLVIAKAGLTGYAVSTYKMGISICNPKDQFNKKLGRKIAYGRMLNAEPRVKGGLSIAAHEVTLKIRDSQSLKIVAVNDMIEQLRMIFNTLEERMKNK